MKVLVTGTSGLLGRSVATLLRDRGDQVSVLQRSPSGLAGVREFLVDLSDREAVSTAVAGHDAVVHLAAKVDVVGRWADFERVNLDGTDAVVSGCRAAGVRRLVHVSSPSVAHAGRSLIGVGAGPADPVAARGPYARSKAFAEQLALAADDPERLSVIVVRPHLVWGPGDRQLVGRIVDRARAGRLPIIGSGAPLVDTTYLENAAEAIVAALDAAERAHGERLVISNGEPRPIGELVASICRAAGVEPPQRRIATPVAMLAGSLAQTAYAARTALAARTAPGAEPTTPPLTRFLVEQLSTAHWFDQRHTREVLRWTPRVSLAEGFERLHRSF